MGANAAPQSRMKVQPFSSVSSLFLRRWESRYRVPADPATPSLDAVRIQLDGTLAAADGLVLNGNTLYSVVGAPGVVKLKLSQQLTSG